MSVNSCPYCGSRTRPNWLTCGEGETCGCGGALAKRKQTTASFGITTGEATENLIRVFGCQSTDREAGVCVTSPGMRACEFGRRNHTVRRVLSAKNNAIDAARDKLGRRFLPVFERILRPLSGIVGA